MNTERLRAAELEKARAAQALKMRLLERNKGGIAAARKRLVRAENECLRAELDNAQSS